MSPASLEERLRTAVQAETDRIEPDETGSLQVIRSRGRSARRRRRVIAGAAVTLAVAAGLVMFPRVGGDGSDVETIDRPDRSSTTTTTARETTTSTSSTTSVAASPGPTAATAPTSTTASTAPAPVASDLPPVLWPGPAHAGFTDPVAAARSFVQEAVGFGAPALSSCRCALSAGAGEVDVYSQGEDGQPLEHVASTLTVLRVDGRWYLTAARAGDVVVDQPGAGAGITSPVTVQGQGSGFEGTIHVVVRAAFASAGQALARATTTASGSEELLPFSVTLSFAAPSPSALGAVVATTDTPIAGGTVSFTAIPVTLG
jgi:Immunoglobulin-like domain of bacterial spore germination